MRITERHKVLYAVLFVTVLLGLALIVCPAASYAQQVADENYRPPITNPAYPEGKGPLVLLDEAHYNFHTVNGRYKAFADILRRDGYRVEANTVPFTKEALSKAQVLVIANALHESNARRWGLPNPSAFTDEEIEAVHEWVNEGGALFLIADHNPFPGAAEKLAAAFGVRWLNGGALKALKEVQPGSSLEGMGLFTRKDGTLTDHFITNGRSAAERVDTVRTFYGSAFTVDKDTNVEPLLVFPAGSISQNPTAPGQPQRDWLRVPVEGWFQGAVLRAGKGKVALFGEAAMFSAQVAGPRRIPVGMNAPGAEKNYQYLLNVLHWLTGAGGAAQ